MPSVRSSKKNCCVVQCKNRYQNTTNISFYNFPGRPWDKEKREKWINAVNRENLDGTKWLPTANSFICSQHFVGNRRSEHPLDPAYVPTIFPEVYNVPPLTESQVNRCRRQSARTEIRQAVDDNFKRSKKTEVAAVEQQNPQAGNQQVAMATVEAVVEYDEITFEQDIFYAAVKVEPDVNQLNSPSFAYVCVKDEPLDYDDVPALGMGKGVFYSNNPDDDAVDPLLLTDLKTEIKQEPNTNAVTYDCPKTVGVCPMPGSSLEVKNEEIQEPTISPRVAGKLPPDRVLPGTARSFPCSVCNEQFKSDAILKQHLVMHSNEKPLSCVKCKKEISSRSYRQIHLKLNSDDKLCRKCLEESRRELLPKHMTPMDSDVKSFSCTQCKKKWKNKTMLQRHMLVHTTDRPYSCDQCDGKFKDKFSLHSHMRWRHSVCMPLSCNLCDKTFGLKKALKCHMISHSLARPFSCSLCPTTCKTQGMLKAHLKIHSKETPYSCTKCEKNLKTKRYLELHMLVHTSERPFPCSQCKSTFKLKTCLKSHMWTHSTEAPYTCVFMTDSGECLAKFRAKQSLRRHMDCHLETRLECLEESRRELLPKHSTPMDSDDKSFSCTQCKTKFKYKHHLQSHMLVHTTERPYSCDQCNGKFKDKISLKGHMTCRHSVFVRLFCNLCEKTFGCKSALKAHMICHSLARPFSCSLCPATFKTQGSFNRHLKIHFEEVRYSCSKCEKKFKTKSNLERHMLVHTDERPFACTQCKSMFKHKSSLKSHMWTHSTEAPYTCVFMTDSGECLAKFNHKHSLRHHMDCHFKTRLQCLEESRRKLLPKHTTPMDSDDKSFSCTQCKTKFKYKHHLQSHMLVHTDERPFACTQCKSTYKRKADLKRHMWTHSREAPYTCVFMTDSGECLAKFNHKHSLRLHVDCHFKTRSNLLR